MQLATVLRYTNLKQGSIWDHRYYIMHDYMLMAWKHRVGLVAVMTEQSVSDACKYCDGLIIPGSGTNIDPSYYGQLPFEVPNEVDEYALDQKLIRAFFRAGKPILGICGGEQAINVFFGGTLAKVPDPSRHSDSTTHSHPINLLEGSFVHQAFQTTRHTVNSHHSWYAHDIAPDFTVTAWTDDGVTEAIEWREKGIFGTQWHPEQTFHTGTAKEPQLFENFLKLCE